MGVEYSCRASSCPSPGVSWFQYLPRTDCLPEVVSCLALLLILVCALSRLAWLICPGWLGGPSSPCDVGQTSPTSLPFPLFPLPPTVFHPSMLPTTSFSDLLALMPSHPPSAAAAQSHP